MVVTKTIPFDIDDYKHINEWNNFLHSTNVNILKFTKKLSVLKLDFLSRKLIALAFSHEFDKTCLDTLKNFAVKHFTLILNKKARKLENKYKNSFLHYFSPTVFFNNYFYEFNNSKNKLVPLVDDQKHLIVNLSDFKLTKAQCSILEKGLSFSPTPFNFDKFDILRSFNDFFRQIKFSALYTNNKDSSTDVKNKEDCIEFYQNCVLADISKLLPKYNKQQQKPNLSESEKRALSELKRNKDIIIKKADKGGAVVILNRIDYINEAMRQLNDDKSYKKLDEDPSNYVFTKINKILKNLENQNLITKNIYNKLKCKDPSIGRFYLLPKIHKEGNPGRPIISSCGTITENISAFVDSFLKSIPPLLPSYIKDSIHFLNKIKQLNDMGLPRNIILCTLDVASLYTNIPHKEGIEACFHFLKKYNNNYPLPRTICNLIQIILENNYFEFDNNYYLQIQGTAMGTKMAPNYANIFMGLFEASFLNSIKLTPLVWYRYIDDIFLIWTHSLEQLYDFIEQLNSVNEHIQFSNCISSNTVNFLDIKIINNDGKLKTTLFRKVTDKRQYLKYDSFHPKSCVNSIPYSQMTRIRRICSEDQDFHTEINTLIFDFSKRGYPRSILDNSRKKALSLNRESLLAYKQKLDETNCTLVLPYNHITLKLKNILQQHHQILHTNEKLKKLFPDFFRTTFKRSKNLHDILIRSKVSPKPDTSCNDPSKTGSIKCLKMNCVVCPYLVETDCLMDSHNNTLRISKRIYCYTTNAIYRIRCTLCNKNYIGETGRELSTRIKEHLSDIKHRRQSPVSLHFNNNDHSIQNLEIYFLGSCYTNDNTRKQFESLFIHRFNSVHPNGINLNSGIIGKKQFLMLGIQ